MTPPEPTADGHLRPSWARSDRPVPRRVVQPLQRFLKTEAAGGALLLVGIVVALAWANSSLSDSYRGAWETPVTIRIWGISLFEDLRSVVNEGLMTVFFFVVGLEIKREIVSGELRDRRAAALPVIGAVGGMALPALIYLAFNGSGPAARGWAVPMATDIALAVGVLAVVGGRIPPSLRVFLLAFAIVDDIGSIVIITLLSPADVSWVPLGVAVGLLGTMGGLHRLGMRWMVIYVVLGLGVWAATFQAGISTSMAGAILGLLAPAATSGRARADSADAHRTISPLARLERALHPWTSYAIVPLFALANAGIPLSSSSLVEDLSSPVVSGVVVGRVVGKALGILALASLAVRLGWAALPSGVGWRQLAAVSTLGGIGFAVSLVVANIALPEVELLRQATLGILAATVLAGAIGAALIVWTSRGYSLEEKGDPRP